MTKTQEDTATLNAFEGWETPSDIDFFGEKPNVTDVEKVIDAVEKTDIDTTKKEDTKEKSADADDAAENIEFFETNEFTQGDSTDDEEGEEDDSTKTSKTGADKISAKATLSFLKEKGLVEYELEEGEELTDELANDLLEDSIDDSVETKVKSLISGLPETVKNLVTLATNGGDVDGFIASLATKPTNKITKDLDLEKLSNQELVVRTARLAEGDDEETVNSYIDFLKESGKLQGVSEKEHAKIVDKQAKELKAQAEALGQKKAADKKRAREFKSDLVKYITETNEINSLPLSKKDKQDLPSFIADRTAVLEDGRSTTPMQKALFDVLQNKEKTVLLAKLLQNDFDFSEITKAEKTKYTKEVKKGLSRSQSSTSTNTRSSRGGALADYF